MYKFSHSRKHNFTRPLTIVGAFLTIATLSLPSIAQAPAGNLPVKRVTLFTSGVAYTERGGEVDGDAQVPLTFRTAQINDILKSMVLLDSGGKVQPATYGSRDPIGRSLQAFAIDVTQTTSRETVLQKLRGVRVAITSSGGQAVEGQVIGVETKTVSLPDNKSMTVPYVTLLTESGLITAALEPDKSVKILDQRLDKEFHDAITLLATGMDDQRRDILLHFAGNGRRDVRVGYVMEAPIWKISYRLMMKPNAEPYLQGWALVENTTDEDWNGVRLSLVSGRPVSFIQDLYQPLYIPRPVVGPDIVASPYPQTHDSGLGVPLANKIGPDVTATLDSIYNPLYSGAVGGQGGGLAGHTLIQRQPATTLNGGRGGAFGPMGDSGAPGPSGAPGGGFGGGGGGFSGDAAKKSIDAMAAGEKAGEMFQYNIDTPISLPRQRASMIPVISGDIKGEKVSLYNADTASKFPMNAIRLKNSTALHLKGGSMTIFDGDVYAGDARIEDVPPGETRLVTYAVDLDVNCERQQPTIKNNETTVKIAHGVLTANRREVTETTYTFKSRADKVRNLLVEHPFDSTYTLMEPAKADERTTSLYRFGVTVNPGESKTLKVVVERPLFTVYTILDADTTLLAGIIFRPSTSDSLKRALNEVIRRRQHVNELKAAEDKHNNSIKEITDDQDRIRKNMESLDKNSNLYKRYVSELDAQETKMETLRLEATKLHADVLAAQQELSIYINSINE